MAISIEQLSYELTATALTEQERALAGLRACAGTVLGAASIAGSFLGARAGGGSLDIWGILAMISFALCFGCAIWVLLPHGFLSALSNWLSVSCVLLAVEVALWTICLAG